MSVTVKLYGRFREIASRLDSPSETIGVVEVDSERVNKTFDLLDEFGLDRDEVSHVFVNGSYSSLQRTLDNKDKVAIFPDDMGLLYSWYFKEEK